MNTITRELAKKLIENSNTIFSVQFIKKDGSIRDMVCRKGVTKYLKGGKNTVAGYTKYITVFEMPKQEYRNINIETLQQLKINGNEYTIKG